MSMTDATTNIQQLKDFVATFVEDGLLNMSIAIETADMPHELVREELAGIVIYCLTLANTTGIDLSSAIREKVVEMLRNIR
jgi:NTP pyrophosphatase (non-canonical NTP hydrolase)